MVNKTMKNIKATENPNPIAIVLYYFSVIFGRSSMCSMWFVFHFNAIFLFLNEIYSIYFFLLLLLLLEFLFFVNLEKMSVYFGVVLFHLDFRYFLCLFVCIPQTGFKAENIRIRTYTQMSR